MLNCGMPHIRRPALSSVSASRERGLSVLCHICVLGDPAEHLKSRAPFFGGGRAHATSQDRATRQARHQSLSRATSKTKHLFHTRLPDTANDHSREPYKVANFALTLRAPGHPGSSRDERSNRKRHHRRHLSGQISAAEGIVFQ
jgi:hypothetical protein